ncbi:hypothetical protein COEREDRAFT_83966, partial [Coemansia reversa NRRL 1564]
MAVNSTGNESQGESMSASCARCSSFMKLRRQAIGCIHILLYPPLRNTGDIKLHVLCIIAMILLKMSIQNC